MPARINIDWPYVNDLIIAGCSGAEIAGEIGIHPVTLYEKCLEENGSPYSEYSLQFKSKGKALLRKQQFMKALGKTELGDNTMLVWLGKTRLKQKEDTLTSPSITINTINYSNADTTST